MKTAYIKGIGFCLSCIILTCLLNACGFHFKGNSSSINSLKSIHIKGENRFDDIAAEVRQLAKSHGIETNNKTEWSISLSDEDLDKWQASTTQSVTTKEYILRLSVNLEISHFGHPLKPINLYAEALFQDNNDEIASKENEKAMIIAELRNELASNILRQVTFIANNPPDCDHQNEAESTTVKQ